MKLYIYENKALDFVILSKTKPKGRDGMAGIYVGEVELDVKDITPVVTNTKTKMVMSVEHLKNIVIPREAKNIRIVFDIEEPYPQSISDPIEKPAFLRKIMD